MPKPGFGMKFNKILLIVSILLGLLCQPSSQGIYHPPSPNFLLECTKGRSAQGCWSAYGTYCDKNGFIRNPKPNSRTECVGQTKGWCHCSRVADDIIENPYYKWPPGDTDLPGPFGPGGVSGTSSYGTPYGYMAWESFKLKKGSNSTNSTNATYIGPPPLLVLHDSAGHARPASEYKLVVLALGAVISGLTSSWEILLVLGPAVLPQVAANPDASAKFLLENPYYKSPNVPNTELPGSIGPGGVGGTSGSAAPFGYMAWESLKDKADGLNATNSTNATYTGPAPLLVLPESAANTQTAIQSGEYAVALMTSILGAIICSLIL